MRKNSNDEPCINCIRSGCGAGKDLYTSAEFDPVINELTAAKVELANEFLLNLTIDKLIEPKNCDELQQRLEKLVRDLSILENEGLLKYAKNYPDRVLSTRVDQARKER